VSLFSRFVKRFFGDPHEKKIKEFLPVVEQINSFEGSIKILSDDELKAKTVEFRARLDKKATLDDILPEAFAVVRETAKRVLNMRHFDVQLIGGIVLHQGKISEMRTGEGKTLVATLPAYLNALEGKGVYIVTVNDYLAKRDSEWMGQIYRFLGLTVGLIQSGMETEEKKEAYEADITFGTNNEFGFDYLRDNLAWDLEQCSQNRRNFAIVDEVDSILIDEARTPLIISGPVRDSTSKYIKIARIVKYLKKEEHFTLDEKHKNVVLTEEGTDKLEKEMGLGNIYSVENMDVAHMAIQCLKALYLFKRDVDYVVKNGEVMIVDEFTGRIMDGRRYSDGLHQSIEAIEGVVVQNESQTLASITYQNYFRMFPKLAGMTGTAETEAPEFDKIYGLEVLVIPTNKPMVRKDCTDLVYKSKEEKYKAIVNDIRDLYKKGQPVLVGTIAIETSEIISGLLKQFNVPHNVLNAKYHEREAEIVSNAGQPQAVTIATNMAGRGTDIVLGEGVKELGGLCVFGTERHESRRIDNQLRGRSGRQGDPGVSKFFVSLDDDLMRLFGSDRIAKVMDTLGVPSDTPIEHPWIAKSIERAQMKVEKYHFSIRKQVLEYDDVMNKQRETVYALRRQILEKKNLDNKVKEMIGDITKSAVAEFYFERAIDTKEELEVFEGFVNRLQSVFPIENLKEIVRSKARAAQIEELTESFYKFYLYRKNDCPPGLFEEAITKRTLLFTLDKKWMDHLHNMDVLREGIGLRAWGQKDPLVEYKMEGFDMFKMMLVNVAEEALSLINRYEIVGDERELETDGIPVVEPQEMSFSSAESSSVLKTQRRADDKVGRNDPCPCGSGKKYKKCCMN
jgi:preprotein translocase subunit SecA